MTSALTGPNGPFLRVEAHMSGQPVRGIQAQLFREWCEEDVLRRIKRGTLQRLRDEISPVEGDVLGRFLVDWHGVGPDLWKT